MFRAQMKQHTLNSIAAKNDSDKLFVLQDKESIPTENNKGNIRTVPQLKFTENEALSSFYFRESGQNFERIREA